MLTRRIIPCLDVLNGRVVKGRKFQDLVDMGDPVELATRYSEDGADEIVLLDISASLEERRPFFDIVRQVARCVAIPLTVGGGIRTIEDIVEVLRCGADKVSLNSVLVADPTLLTRAAERVGSQALVGSIDAQRVNGSWKIRIRSGTRETEWEALAWATTLVQQGAGELLVTSMDRDGMRKGYDIALLSELSHAVHVPIIASGGAGNKEHVLEALREGHADAVLAASIFHLNEIPVPVLKRYLSKEGVPIRL